ncbi:unnamed protein product, partial [Closterium sp. Naga37s-1]
DAEEDAGEQTSGSRDEGADMREKTVMWCDQQQWAEQHFGSRIGARGSGIARALRPSLVDRPVRRRLRFLAGRGQLVTSSSLSVKYSRSSSVWNSRRKMKTYARVEANRIG